MRTRAGGRAGYARSGGGGRPPLLQMKVMQDILEVQFLSYLFHSLHSFHFLHSVPESVMSGDIAPPGFSGHGDIVVL